MGVGRIITLIQNRRIVLEKTQTILRLFIVVRFCGKQTLLFHAWADTTECDTTRMDAQYDEKVFLVKREYLADISLH